MTRILIVEDNPHDLRQIEGALISLTQRTPTNVYETTHATTLSQGLSILKRTEVDIVLLDMELPDAHEFEGIEQIEKAQPGTAVIVLTRRTDDSLIGLEALKHGAQEYLNKNLLGDAMFLKRAILYAVERKRMDEELVSARETALKASQAKSEFLSNVSHDIRTPLNSIIGVSDLLSRAQLSEENRNYVHMLKRASDNLLSLINNVLDLSKIESGVFQPECTSFDLLSLMESVLEIMSVRAHAKGLELVFKMEPGVPRYLNGDSGLLNQIFVNLVGNAIKFTKSGEVLISVSALNYRQSSVTLNVSVKDTGIGMPQGKLDDIFESFVQLDHGDASVKRQGSGLGLAICRRLIHLMNGQIQVKSSEGAGSTFELQIPLQLADENWGVVALPSLNLNGKNILVLADNVAHGMILADLLKSWRATVIMAKTRAEGAWWVKALKVEGKKIDIALVDLRLPGVAAGGLEFAQEIKNEIKDLVMMLPTNHRYGDMDRLRAVGIQHYYFKPTKPDTLAEILKKILSPDSEDKEAIVKIEENTAAEKPLRILVADDSEDNRLLVEAYFKGSGFSLEIAEDGRQAFEKFKRDNFDLVLMDLQMPAMNGYEALRAIRRWEVTQQAKRQVPILALTAFALKEESEKCLSAGFIAHVTKPITKSVLMQTIRKYAS